ncbi:uncharacterized protein LOC121008567 [Bufo bufo]|uniref:uncharacterized protein LOC121008567 n=1 Tax=Bufo bufo TaxID=8384 RepID=UPI001ABE7C54|nr:uncharacterized protein LOC121008567 [Bufo bufo]
MKMKIRKQSKCVSCLKRLPDDYRKRLCKDCISSVIAEEQPSFIDELRSMIHEEVKTSLFQMPPLPRDPPPPKKRRGPSPSLSDPEMIEEDASSSRAWEDEAASSDIDTTESDRKFCFSLDEMPDLLRAVRATMGEKETPRAHSVQDEMFGRLRVKKTRMFPINENIRDMVLDEWSNPEKRLGVSRSFKNRLLFDTSEVKIFSETPKVDIQVAKVNKKTALPFEDTSQLRDPMDRKADSL